MGLLDSITSKAAEVLSNAGHGESTGMTDVIAELISPEKGGLQALVNTFREKGLGDIVTSWIGTGENLPISGEQLKSVLGNEQVQAIAQKLGVSPADASNALADSLPQIVDKLTPNGQLPEGNLIEQGLALLKGFGGKT